MEYTIVVFTLSRKHQKVVARFRSLMCQPQPGINTLLPHGGLAFVTNRTFSQYSSIFKLPPRLVTTRTYARRLPTSFSFPFPVGGLEMASYISSSSSHTRRDGWVPKEGSTDVDVRAAPGRPVEYGDMFPIKESHENESGHTIIRLTWLRCFGLRDSRSRRLICNRF